MTPTTPSTPTRGGQLTRWDPQVVSAINDAFFGILKPRRIRPMREFAEAEIRLPDGPRAGELFRCSDMPFSGDVLDRMGSGFYNEFYAQAARQSGKTLLFFQIPLMYHLFECQEDVIIGVPKIELAREIWERRIVPMIKDSQYKDLMPKKGPGSKGGTTVKQVTFANGARLLFMSKGLSHTARVVIFTEVYQMQEIASKSDEGNPFEQILRCTEAFGGARRVYAECIVTTEHAGVWDRVAHGSDSKIFLRCPHCRQYVVPDREQFGGFEGHETDKKAAENAHYKCQECGKKWRTEKQHVSATTNYKVVDSGQTIGKDGTIAGERTDTYTFGITWSRMHSTLRPKKREGDLDRTNIPVIGVIGIAEWKASRSDDPGVDLAVSQYTWATPVQQDATLTISLSTEQLLQKITNVPRCEIPAGFTELVVGIDIGETWHWWVACAFNKATGEGHVIDYGGVPVPIGRETTGMAMQTALRRLREGYEELPAGLDGGWRCGEDVIQPRLVLVDSGYGRYATEIYDFVAEAKNKGQYFATKGQAGPTMPKWHEADPKTKNVKRGNNWQLVLQKDRKTWLCEMHTNHWKTRVQDRLLADVGAPGSLTLFNTSREGHMQFIRHLLAEERKEVVVKSRAGGIASVFAHIGRRPNHYFDCMYECLVGADMIGIRTYIPATPGKPKRKMTAKERRSAERRRQRRNPRRRYSRSAA